MSINLNYRNALVSRRRALTDEITESTNKILDTLPSLMELGKLNRLNRNYHFFAVQGTKYARINREQSGNDTGMWQACIHNEGDKIMDSTGAIYSWIGLYQESWK